MPGQKDGRTDRPYFIGPFQLPSGVQKLTDMKTCRWVQKQRKKFKKPTISLANAGPLDRVSVLSTKCGGCHPKVLIVGDSHKIKQIKSQFSGMLHKNKNQLKILFSPLVPPNFWN